ncbi:hypothetical protein [Corynebacterium tapiri]|uniref:Uncharacterized protein n=1 Tax=Corynebacterium tapiri TaxID=1448266 RepID=A0A5C4U5K7_9CORY|nr:hypothetical protein [Corynebacterium tapiri]TNL99368.1 hypothetical protein FHE74_03150 [Corynebacterium tapiri]
MTTALSPSSTTHLLIPALQWRREDTPRARRVAAVALSTELNAVITLASVAQSATELGCMGLSIRQAWEESADNLLALAGSPDNVELRVRPGPDSYHLFVRGTRATSWLAHPRTFHFLHRTVRSRVGFDPVFHLPALDSEYVEVSTTRRTRETFTHSAVYRNGFPVPAHLGHTRSNAFLLAA